MKRGRRECRVSDDTRGSGKKVPGVVHRFTGFNRHSLRNGFTVSFVLSPATGLCCHRRQRDAKDMPSIIADLTPATGRQDHTTSPCAGSIIRPMAPPAPIASRTQRP
jgi:hypothetical protein